MCASYADCATLCLDAVGARQLRSGAASFRVWVHRRAGVSQSRCQRQSRGAHWRGVVARRLAVLALVIVLAGCLPPSGVHNEINVRRVEHHVATLGWSLNLANYAQEHSEWMAATGLLEHSDLAVLLARFPDLVACGENIAHTSSYATAQQIVDAWQASPPHYSILVGPWTIEGDAISGVWVTAEFCR